MKALLRYLLYQWRFPGATICWNAVVARPFSYGPGVHVGQGSFLANVTIGRYSYCAVRAQICNATIGSFCSIAPDVRIGLGRHPAHFVSTYPGLYASRASGVVSFGARHAFAEYETVRIGNDVWIGAGAMIMDGVTIGDGAVVGAGCVVTKDVPPYAVVVGVPGQVRKYRFSDDVVAALLGMRWWDWDESTIRERVDAFGDPERFVALYGGSRPVARSAGDRS